MAKLSQSTLAGLKKEELVDYAVQLQNEKGGGWHGGHFAAILAALLVGFLIKGGLPSSLLGKSTSLAPKKTTSPRPATPAPPKAPARPAKADVKVGSLPVKGKKSAPVTIVEFSDFQCPFCGRFFNETLPKIQKEYIDSGKVKFYYRDFPLTSLHENAQKAAEAARCANEQGSFWAYHDLIFKNQRQLSEDALKQWAADLKLDTSKFNDCLDSGKYEQAVKDDFDAGSKAGVNGTPAFFVNGRLVSGAQPFDNFKKVIEGALKDAS
jgi:protein-disulfide isomerase